MTASDKKYFKPTSLDQAIALSKDNPGNCRYIAGGTDLFVNKFQGTEKAATLIDLSGLKELNTISTIDNQLVLGALVPLDTLESDEQIRSYFPVISEVARSIASPTIRNTATIGGNILCENRCSFYNQSELWREAAGYCLKSHGDTCLASGGKKSCFSKFVSDMAIILISLNATIEIIDEFGSKNVAIESIYSGDGINPRILPKTAIIKNIQIPLGQECRTIYKKLRKRATIDFTSLTSAITINKSGKIKIVLGGVHAKPLVMEGSISDDFTALINQAISLTRIVDNDTYSRGYRKEMITIFLKKSINELGSAL